MFIYDLRGFCAGDGGEADRYVRVIVCGFCTGDGEEADRHVRVIAAASLSVTHESSLIDQIIDGGILFLSASVFGSA